MTRDQRVADLLNEAVPFVSVAGDWEAVVRDAGRREPLALRVPHWTLVGGVAALVLAAALAWPFGSAERGGFFERALAAAGDGPVLHVVLRDEATGTFVELRTGRERPADARRSIWYDPERGVRQVSAEGGTVVEDFTVPAGRAAGWVRRTVVGLSTDYRRALRDGTARVTERGTLDGAPVAWVTVAAEQLLDEADGRLHEWAKEVAISTESYRPVYIRETRDGRPAPGTGQHIVSFETLPAGSGDFDASPVRGRDLFVVADLEGDPIDRGRAAAELGRTPVWLGARFEGLELTRVARHAYRWGRPRVHERGTVVRVTGPPADWESTVGVSFRYGGSTSDPTPYPAGPHVTVTQVARPTPALRALAPLPPPGYVRLEDRRAVLRHPGLVVEIHASSRELALAAARALRPFDGR